MKPAKLWILGVMLVCVSGACARAPEEPPPEPPPASAEEARALAVYEQGKQLYDAQDYAGALARFDEAAAIEPGKARWHYNRGLALRKLRRIGDAMRALNQSRALDPDYKRAEIDDKLRQLDADARGTSDGDSSKLSSKLKDFGMRLCVFVGFGGLVFLLVWMVWRALGSSTQGRPGFTSSPGQRMQQRARLTQASEMLIQVEHALRTREDADLRAQLNQATQSEQRARQALERAEKDLATSEPVTSLVDDVQRHAQRALGHARELFGEQALLPKGERVGCYFCARPLANPDFRRRVPLKRRAQVHEVLACPPCANMAATGEPPPVTVQRRPKGRIHHWSELPHYDPYTHRHQPLPDMGTALAWEKTSLRPLGEVATLAAGGLATGLAAYGVSQLLDLDSVSEEVAAQAAARAATQAAAKKASEQREERDWKDHS